MSKTISTRETPKGDPRNLDIERRARYRLKRAPKEPDEQNLLADEMIDWVDRWDHVFDINSFPIFKGYSPYRLFKIAEANEYFAECLELAKHIICQRRDKAARERTQDATYILKTLPLYSREYREWEIERNKRDIEARENKTITVVMERFPEVASVKEIEETRKDN